MTRLANSTKVIILECRINSTRDTVHLVEQVAKVLDVDIGEDERNEWIQLMHIRNINVNKGAIDAKTN
jgi:hypothetical protein